MGTSRFQVTKLGRASRTGGGCLPTKRIQPGEGSGGETPVRIGGEERTTLFLHALIANCPVAIVVLDSQHKVQICNPAFERLFLYSQKELKRANLDKLIADKTTRSQAVALTKRVLAGHTVQATTIRRRKDGTKVEVEIHGIPLMVRGLLVGVYGLYQDVTESKRTERLLRELSGQLLRLQDEERRRIARELHDSTAQSLSALGMNLTRLKGCAGDLSTRKLLSDSIALAEQCDREIRTLTYLLHPPLLDEAGLASAISWYVNGLARRSGIHVDLKISPNLGRLPREYEMALYRIAQESLTNVVRHSRSSIARIQIARTSSHIIMDVKDQGRGIPSHYDHHGETVLSLGVGIVGMEERLRQLGGRLELSSSRQGTTVRAVLPIQGRFS